jgi:hypothetical protein
MSQDSAQTGHCHISLTLPEKRWEKAARFRLVPEPLSLHAPENPFHGTSCYREDSEPLGLLPCVGTSQRGHCRWLFKNAHHLGTGGHVYNPSYSGGRDLEDGCLKTAWANSLWDPILKKLITRKGWWSGSRYRPWVQNPVSHAQKKKNPSKFLS